MGITSTLFHDKIPLLLIKTAHKWQSSELQFSRKPFFFQDLIASKNLLVDFCNARAFWQKPCHELLKVYYLESSEAIFWFIPILICSFSFIFLIIYFFSSFWKTGELFSLLSFQNLLLLFNTSYQLKMINLIMSVLLFLSW